jgi:photosystem II stability/assembly factor-like uncharacterized protein
MRFANTEAPRRSVSRPGPANLAFVSRQVGYAATTGGAHNVPRAGVALNTDRGRIERTDDGGRTWRTLWSAPGVVFDSISVSRRVIVAGGTASNRKNCRGAALLGGCVLVASTDGGRSWHRSVPPVGGAVVQVLTPTTWMMSSTWAGPAQSNASRVGLFRTVDAGRHWQRLQLPRRAELVRFVTPTLGLTGAAGAECPHASQIWRTEDGSRTWTPVSGTCGRPITSIDAVSSRLLLVAQTTIVRRSTDEGRSWRTAWHEDDWTVTKLAFADSRRGLVIRQRWIYRGYELLTGLRATTDGGSTWNTRTLPYNQHPITTASGFGPTVPTAFLKGRFAWAGDNGAGVVWRTFDGGRSWQVSAEPESVLPNNPRKSGQNAVTVDTSAGPAVTRDGGKTWAPALPPSDAVVGLAEHRHAYLQLGKIPCDADYCPTTEPLFPTVSSDNGKTWRRLSPPEAVRATGAGAVAFTDGRHGLISSISAIGGSGLPVFATADAGRSWQSIPVPPGLEASESAFLGPGVIVIAPGSILSVTTDNGRRWQEFPVAKETYECSVSRPAAANIWVLCSNFVLIEKPHVVLLTTDNGGRTWTRRTTAMLVNTDYLAAMSRREAWVASYWPGQANQTPRIDAPGKFWHTTDGGATWRQAWVALDPSAQAVAVTN